MKFWYEGFNVGGIVSSGEFEAENREEAASYLRSKGLYPQQIREVGVEEVKPVLPQEKKTFEDELGFIDQKPLREKKEAAYEEFQKETDADIFKQMKMVLEAKEAEAKEKCSSSCCGGNCSGEPLPSMVDTQEVTKEVKGAGQIEQDMTALAEGANEVIDYMVRAMDVGPDDRDTRDIIKAHVQKSAERLLDKILWSHVERSRGPRSEK
jgi:hypothetical protein